MTVEFLIWQGPWGMLCFPGKVFSARLPVFQGFARWGKSLMFLRFSLVFSKRPRKKRTGSCMNTRVLKRSGQTGEMFFWQCLTFHCKVLHPSSWQKETRIGGSGLFWLWSSKWAFSTSKFAAPSGEPQRRSQRFLRFATAMPTQPWAPKTHSLI